MGPPTPRKPNGEYQWICKDYSHLGPGRACVAMYGGPEPGHPEYPNILGEMKALQRGINDAIDKYGLSHKKIIVDGTIGPKTMAAYRAVAARAGSLPAAATADDLAFLNYSTKLYTTIAQLTNATADTSIVKRSDDERGAPAVVEDRASGPRPGEEPSETPSWVWWLIGGAAAVGVGALGYSLHKRRKVKPVKKKRRPARRAGRAIRVRPHTRFV